MFLGAPWASMASPTRNEGVDGVGPSCPGRGVGRLGGVEGVKRGVGRDEALARRGPSAIGLTPTGGSGPEGLEGETERGGPSTTSAMVGKPAAVAATEEGQGRRSRGTSGEVGERGEEAER